MKNFFFVLKFFLFFSFLVSCDKEKKHIPKETKWKIYNDKKMFPEPIKNFFTSYYGADFVIANPNEKFNITDAVIDSKLPSQQLRLLENKNNFWRLVFVQGGIGKSYQYYEFEIKNDTISKITKGSSFENIETHDSLEYYMKKQKVNF